MVIKLHLSSPKNWLLLKCGKLHYQSHINCPGSQSPSVTTLTAQKASFSSSIQSSFIDMNSHLEQNDYSLCVLIAKCWENN